jgi:hypothetical protein
LAVPAVWGQWAVLRPPAEPDAPALPREAERAVAAGRAAALPRAGPAEPVALLRVARAAVAVPLRAEPAVVAAQRVGAVARLREVGADAAALPQVVPAAVALPLAAAWAFRRDRLRLAVRRRSAPSARAMRSLRTASP